MTSAKTIPTNCKNQGIWGPEVRMLGSIVLYMHTNEKTELSGRSQTQRESQY